MRLVVLTAAAALAAGLLSACSSSTGVPTLTWYINPDSGGQATLAKECSTAQYKIDTSILPNDASAQRQQLVTRLAAKDGSISLMSLDPVFVAEFSEAGFLADIPQSDVAGFTKDIVQPAVQASTWKGKLVTAPFWANTQLLWYRKSIAKQEGLDMTKPVTWDQIIKAAQQAKKTVGVQADKYEGYTVWLNALIAGAGGQIVQNPGATVNNIKLGVDSTAGRDAAGIIQELVRANVGGPALSTNMETQSLNLFEQPSTSAFVTIWPYIWAQMATDKVSFRDSDVGWTTYPETVAGQQAKPPFGGIEIGVGAYTKYKGQALAATQCITSEAHQEEYMLSSGNPAANTKVYDSSAIQKLFPMADLIRSSLQIAAPRPQTQYYGDLSSALQSSFSAPNSVTQSTPATAQKYALDVIKGKRLLS